MFNLLHLVGSANAADLNLGEGWTQDRLEVRRCVFPKVILVPGFFPGCDAKQAVWGRQVQNTRGSQYAPNLGDVMAVVFDVLDHLK